MGQFDSLDAGLRDAAQQLFDAAANAGLSPRVTSTLRSSSTQGRLYRRYLAGGSGFPALPPGYSAHEYGWAFDMVTSPMEALADVGYTWQTWGGGWSPGDAVHFELPGASDTAKQLGDSTLKRILATGETPWWVDALTAFAPLALTFEKAPDPAAIRARLCQLTGLACGS